MNKLIEKLLLQGAFTENDKIIESMEKYPHAYLLLLSTMDEFIDSKGLMKEYCDFFEQETEGFDDLLSEIRFKYKKHE